MEKDNIKNDINCEYSYPEDDWFYQINRVIDTLYFEETYKYLEKKYNNK